MPSSARLVVAVLLVALVTPTAAGLAQDWPRWRGSAFDGTVVTGRGIFDQPFELRVRWTKTIGAGYSAIVVAGGRAITMASDGGIDYLVALSADSGDEQWRVPIGRAFPARDGSAGGPVSTPAIAGDTVYAIGPFGDLVAVDLVTGRPRWKRALVAEFGSAVPHWGITTSPLVVGRAVVVLTGGAEGAVTAFDRDTGAVLWRAGADGASYQSPMLARVAGEARIVVGGDEFLFALDPADGREVWRHPHGGQGFYGLIINPVVTASDRLLLTHRPDSSVLLDTAGATPSPVWSTRELKLNYGTPVVHEGLVYGYSGGFLTAVDAGTGTLAWRSRAPGDGFIIVVDGHLVVMTKAGALHVAKTGREGFAPVASLDVFERLVWTPPAFAGGRVFVRDSYERMAAIDVVPAPTGAAAAPEVETRGVIPGTAFARWVAETEAAPDAQQRVDAFLARQSRFPLVEGDRYAHVVYTGEPGELLMKSDAFEIGDDLPLRRVGGTNMYYASLALAPDARIAYQLVRGLEDPFVDPRNPTQGTSLSYAGPVSLLYMPSADATRVEPSAGDAPTGAVQHRIEGAVVRAENLRWTGERTLTVQLPADYHGSADRYPVVYVLYGDEMRAARLDALIAQEVGASIPPVITVFVPSTSAYEYARTFRPQHRDLLIGTIVPFVDRTYRTVARAEARVLAGADEAAFGAIETAMRHPTVFGGVIAQSAYPLSTGGDELLALIGAAPLTPQRFHVDWGIYDPRRSRDLLDVPGFTARVAGQLRARGFAVTGRGWHDGSALEFWVSRFREGLRAVVAPGVPPR